MTTGEAVGSGCTCMPTWPGLTALVNAVARVAVPAANHSASEGVSTATCTGCGSAWPGHWTLAAIADPASEAVKNAPKNAVDLLRLLVSARAGSEVRPQQEKMVELVEQAIAKREHLIIQAGTGTGKSLGYLIPAIAATGKRVVISTATKQLGEQLVEEDLPVLQDLLPQVGGKPFTYALIKGRNNYACKAQIDELTNLDSQADEQGITDALFEMETQQRAATKRPSSEDLKHLNAVLQWAEKTESGDRSQAPAVSDKVWNQVSIDSAGCPGRSACAFGNDCFAEKAREDAREADVVVANHALIAQDLRAPAPMLGEWDVLVADEVHELESYLSSAWGHEVVASAMKHVVALHARKLPGTEGASVAKDQAVSLVADLEALGEMLKDVQPGLLPLLPGAVQSLLATIVSKLLVVASAFDRSVEKHGSGTTIGAQHKGAAGKMREAAEAVTSVLAAGDGAVRWLEEGFEKRSPTLKVAPLWIGPRLMTLLGDRTIVATSATITVGDSFDPMVQTLALNEPVRVDGEEQPTPARAFNAVDVGTPFDYTTQGMIYVPNESTFPAPVGKDRREHTAAVLLECTALVTAAGGRTLALFTSTEAARNAAAHLRNTVNTPVLCQGDAPPAQLIKQFADIETSTLCATMGFWHGVNVPGPSLTCVIIDKIPFARIDDPLMSARRKAVENNGGDGFHQVYVNSAAIMLAQGAGRLIRQASDKGVVAILDTRIMTKPSYSATLLRSLPPMWRTRDRAQVEKALARLVAGRPTSVPSGIVRPALKPSERLAARAGTPRKAAPRRGSTKSLGRSTRGKAQ